MRPNVTDLIRAFPPSTFVGTGPARIPFLRSALGTRPVVQEGSGRGQGPGPYPAAHLLSSPCHGRQAGEAAPRAQGRRPAELGRARLSNIWGRLAPKRL